MKYSPSIPTNTGLDTGRTMQDKNRHQRKTTAQFISNTGHCNQGIKVQSLSCVSRTTPTPLVRSVPCCQPLGVLPHFLPPWADLVTRYLSFPEAVPRLPHQPHVSPSPLWLPGFPRYSLRAIGKPTVTPRQKLDQRVKRRLAHALLPGSHNAVNHT